MVKGPLMAGGMALMLFASLGMASAQQMTPNPQITPNPPTVTVDNTRGVPVVVYLERGKFDVRLGTVPPHGKETLALPQKVEDRERIDVIMHPEGGFDLSTGEFRVKGSGNIDIFVPTNDVGYVPPPSPETMPDPGPGAKVTVQNSRAVPVTVFVERGDFDERIGTVPPYKEVTLPIPDWIAEERSNAEIFVHPEGGTDLESWTFHLTPSSHLDLKVPRSVSE